MSRRVFGLTIIDWLFLILGAVFYAVPSIVSFFIINWQSLQTSGKSTVVVILFIFGLIANMIANGGRAFFLRRENTANEYALADQLITEILKDTLHNISQIQGVKRATKLRQNTRYLRANVMLAGTNGKLRIKYSIHMSKEEEDLEWAKGEGGCGLVWIRTEQQLVFDFTIPPPKHGARFIIPTLKHKKLTRSIKTLLSTKVVNPYNGKFLGMLNIDSNRSLAELNLEHPAILSLTKARAAAIAVPLMTLGIA